MTIDTQIEANPAVKEWQARITAAKAKWEPDFKRMRENTEFAAGLQWEGQKQIRDERYVVNQTLRVLLQKVATLYAKDPRTEVKKRKRLCFTLWDGDIGTIDQMFQRFMTSAQVGVQDMEAAAILQDFVQGRQVEQLIDRVAETLQLVDDYIVDSAKPEFKEQMKQLVTRVITCGVGYLRQTFVRQGPSPLSTTETRHSAEDMAQRAVALTDQVQDATDDEAQAHIETLRSLSYALHAPGQQEDSFELAERVEFDYPPPDSIIPDPLCRSLKEFVNARWIVQEYPLDLDEVNEIFGLNISEQAILVNPESPRTNPDGYKDKPKPRGNVWNVMDYRTKTQFFVLEGFGDYLRAPEPMEFPVSGFWPVLALTFNSIEVSTDSKTSIFPPSDVDLIMHPQKEWNRSRDALRDQRNANAPKYLARKGVLSPEDKKALQDSVANQVVELEGIPVDKQPDDVIKVMQVAAIDPNVYTTQPLSEDMMLSVGVQEANIGPAQPNVTATVGTIAEQSRMTVAASNVDDLDGFLSRAAKMRGELLLQGMSEETVKRIAGPGAVWPSLDGDRQNFLNAIFLSVVAGSSGRPNQAIKIANFERVAPILLNAGANPFAIVEEGVRRLDDQLDVQRFHPLPMMGGAMMQMGQPGPEQQSGPPQNGRQPKRASGPEQPLQEQANMAPVPLAAA